MKRGTNAPRRSFFGHFIATAKKFSHLEIHSFPNSRPPFVILYSRRPHHFFQSHSKSANVFEDIDTIRVSFVPALGDHGKFLSCRAENPHLPSNNAVEDQWKIDVQCT